LEGSALRPPPLDNSAPFKDEWLLTRGYLSKESIALVLEDQGDGSGSEVAALEG
jgi:hypothetical protein